MVKLRFAIPKGSLGESTMKFLSEAGYEIKGSERTYRPTANDPNLELKILRPQEIPIFVSSGSQDIGITGLDWVVEVKAKVKMLLDLEYGKVKLVLAVPKQLTGIESLSDLLRARLGEGKAVRISTEYLNIASRYVKKNPVYREFFQELEPTIVTPWWIKGSNDKVRIFLSFGATEAKPPEDADAIIDVSETGVTLEQNNLKVIETIMESSAVLIANENSLEDPQKKEKILDVIALFKGVVNGRKKLHIFVNVKEENLEELLRVLPALKAPTIAPLSKKGWYSLNTVIDKAQLFEVLPYLRRLAQGLVIIEPRQIMLLEDSDKILEA
jgi:ATP phosphoribosyltransferase